MNRHILRAGLALLLVNLQVHAQSPERENDTDGQAIFQDHCSHCHAPGLNHPGTLQLSLTRGEDNAMLEERDNLAGVYVKIIVRQGLNAMPGFKPTIVTERELEAVVGYLGE